MADLSFPVDDMVPLAAVRTGRGPGAGYRADIVVPCFNEEAVLGQTIPAVLDYMRALVARPDNRLEDFRIILVDDGSRDATWPIIDDFAGRAREVEGLKLSRNFGHQSAMLAGLAVADADVVITMDADLQDDLHAIAGMVAAHEQGAHLALGVRHDRSADTVGKKGWAHGYYRLLSLLGIRIIENHADFRLMSRTALDALLQYREVNLFLRGLIPTLGFTVALVPYKRAARTAGETKYTLRKMLRLALDGITSFSVMPLRAIAFAGATIFLGTMLAAAYFLYVFCFYSADVVPGWASVVLPMLFLGGVQLLSIGVLGEYIGKIYMETKRRPRFIVESATASDLAVRSALAASVHAVG
jgi:glycosyltransferase involved in cell wall biosynthesis